MFSTIQSVADYMGWVLGGVVRWTILFAKQSESLKSLLKALQSISL